VPDKPVIAAEFYRAHKRCVLDINRIEDGVRTVMSSHMVVDKRHARKLAAAHNAVCWNF
jgi:hypothetical protein